MKLAYFAYGSNMLRERLVDRKVVLLDSGLPALAEGYELVFNKKNTDGSSKANLMAKSGMASWGVLFSVDAASLKGLDAAEGAPQHYRRATVVIRTANATQDAMTYLAQPNKILAVPDQPWDWYLALILAGAHACTGIPSEWINHLRRDGRAKTYDRPPSKSFIQAVAQLKAAGHDRWQDLLNNDIKRK